MHKSATVGDRSAAG